MSRSQKIAALAMTVLTGIGIFVFFAFRYRYHLHFQEQYQLFEWTGAYFADVARVPGGLADWLGRCLTQFFYHAPAGAALLAVLYCGVQLAVWAACRRKTLFTYVLSFIPALLLGVFFCDENALAGAIVALALPLAVAALCQRVASRRGRRILELILLPVLYMACGPLGILFAVAAVCREVADGEGKPWLFAFGMLAVAAVTVLVAWRVFPYPFNRLVQGIHYHRFHNILPGLLYAAAVAAALVVLVSCLKARKPLKGIVVPALLFVVLAAAGAFATLRVADPVKEEWMRYDFMVRMQMWNRILQQADRKNPDNPKTVSCLNLALAKTGRLADNQFSYFQNGPEGLIPGFKGDFTNPVSTGEIFWHLGMVNTAQRYAFEAQESIPDFQKSARFYRRLAETNLVNGDTLVAMKYLKVLEHTTFYRSWARETAALVADGTLFEKRPELAQVREFRLKEHDFFFSDTEMDSMLGVLQVEHPENRMALDYLLSWCLLRKDLTRFAECLQMVDTRPLPQTYQEALLLLWVFTHQDFNGLPETIAPVNVQRINRFMADANAGKSEAVMKAAYGNTYWFYFIFRYLNQQQ
ncbi:MAG: hypothetical protein II858_06725 [Bacteroidales bacterium]|nr:hypothetical protein [Bacteroidales bacterium]